MSIGAATSGSAVAALGGGASLEHQAASAIPIIFVQPSRREHCFWPPAGSSLGLGHHSTGTFDWASTCRIGVPQTCGTVMSGTNSSHQATRAAMPKDGCEHPPYLLVINVSRGRRGTKKTHPPETNNPIASGSGIWRNSITPVTGSSVSPTPPGLEVLVAKLNPAVDPLVLPARRLTTRSPSSAEISSMNAAEMDVGRFINPIRFIAAVRLISGSLVFGSILQTKPVR